MIAREVTEPTVRLTGLRTGEMHMINDIPADRMKEVKGDPKFQVTTWFPLELGLRQSQSRFRALQGSARSARDRSSDRQGGAAARRIVGRRPHDRVAQLSNFALLQFRAQKSPAGHRESEATARRRRLRTRQAQYRFQGDDELSVSCRVRADHARMVQGSRRQHDDRAADLGRLAEPGVGQQGLPDLDDELLHTVGAGLPVLQPLALDRRLQLPPDKGSRSRRLSCRRRA